MKDEKTITLRTGITKVIQEISADAMDTSPHIYLLMGISCNASCEICDLSPETEAEHTHTGSAEERHKGSTGHDMGTGRVDKIKLLLHQNFSNFFQQ